MRPAPARMFAQKRGQALKLALVRGRGSGAGAGAREGSGGPMRDEDVRKALGAMLAAGGDGRAYAVLHAELGPEIDRALRAAARTARLRCDSDRLASLRGRVFEMLILADGGAAARSILADGCADAAAWLSDLANVAVDAEKRESRRGAPPRRRHRNGKPDHPLATVVPVEALPDGRAALPELKAALRELRQELEEIAERQPSPRRRIVGHLYIEQAWEQLRHGAPSKASLVNVVAIHERTGGCRRLVSAVMREVAAAAQAELGVVLPLHRAGRRPRGSGSGIPREQGYSIGGDARVLHRDASRPAYPRAARCGACGSA